MARVIYKSLVCMYVFVNEAAARGQRNRLNEAAARGQKDRLNEAAARGQKDRYHSIWWACTPSASLIKLQNMISQFARCYLLGPIFAFVCLSVCLPVYLSICR